MHFEYIRIQAVANCRTISQFRDQTRSFDTFVPPMDYFTRFVSYFIKLEPLFYPPPLQIARSNISQKANIVFANNTAGILVSTNIFLHVGTRRNRKRKKKELCNFPVILIFPFLSFSLFGQLIKE